MINEIIEIKSRRNGWTKVKLLSINRGGTITILVSGNSVTRKIKNIRWGPVYKVAKEQGYTVDSNFKDKKFKSSKNRHKFKKRKIYKSSKQPANNVTKSRRRVTVIAGHKVTFL